MGGEEPKEVNEMSYREGEGDGSDLVENNICKLQKMVSGFFNCICENKEKIIKDPVVKKLVRDYIDNSLETSKFYRELSESLRMEKVRQRVLENGLHNGMTQSEVKEKLEEFTTGEDVFVNFNPRVKPLVETHEKTQAKLDAKVKGLDRKRRPNSIENFIPLIVSLTDKLFNHTPEKEEEKKAVEVNECDVNCAGNPLVSSQVKQLSGKEVLQNVAKIAGVVKQLRELLMKEDEKPDLEKISKLQKWLIREIDGLCAGIDSCLKQLYSERAELAWA